MSTTREVITQVLQDHMKHSVVIRTEQLIDALVSALQQREQEVRAAERERCARVCDNAEPPDYDYDLMASGWEDARVYLSEVIRRDDTPPEGEQ